MMTPRMENCSSKRGSSPFNVPVHVLLFLLGKRIIPPAISPHEDLIYA